VITPPKVLLCAAVACAALLGAAIHAPRAAAATPCWKLLLTDWYDGRIDNVYPLHCYTDALKHLPTDVQEYSSAHDDILRALQNARAELHKEGKTVTPNTLVPANNGGNSKKKKVVGPTGTGTTPTTTSEPGKQTSNLVDETNPSSSPFSVPLPLLVLGGLALLLVAAGAAGLVAKRYQGRKPPS
jgi:Alphavirus glycoprotein J